MGGCHIAHEAGDRNTRLLVCMNGHAARTATGADSIPTELLQLVGGLPGAAVLLAADGFLVVAANQAFAARVDDDVARIEGRDWRTLVSAQDVESLLPYIRRALEEHREIDFVERRHGRTVRQRVIPMSSGGVVRYIAHVACAIPAAMEDAHETRELQLRAAQRIAHVGHFTLEVKSQALTWSDELFRIAGRDPLTFIPSIDAFLDMIHPNERDRVRETVDADFVRLCVPGPDGRAALEGLEYRLTRPDGSIRWLRGESELTFDGGEPVSLLGVVHDVTELRHVEEARAATQQRYRQLVEQAGDGIFHADEDGRHIDVNARGCEILGYSLEEMSKLGIEDIVLPEDASAIMRNVRGLPVGLVVRAERALRQRNGGRVPVELTASRMSDGKLLAIVRDVTERRSAEERLRKSEQGLIEAQRIAKIGSWELDLVQDRVTWSDELFKVFEVDKGRFAASYQAFLEVVHPEDLDDVRDAYARSQSTRTPVEFVHRLRMTDGRLKWVQERCETVFDESGQALRLVGTTQDISDLVRAEEALRKNETRFRTVVESFPSGVLLVDADGRIVLANRELLVQFGYQAEELIGQNVELLVPAAARANHVNNRRAYQSAPSARAMGTGRDLHAMRKDGTLFPVELGLQPIDMPDGPMTLATVIDITERTRAQQELQLHSQVLLAMGEGLHFIDSQGIIRFTNPALDAMFGYERGELLGKHATVLNDAGPEENARISRAIKSVSPTKGAWEGEFRNQRKDGSIFYSRARISAIERQGSIAFVGIQEDITQRRTDEQRIRDSLREKETLLREVHHRVKNNLQIVCSLLSLQRTAVSDASAREVLVDCEDRVRIIAMIHEQLYQSSDFGAIELGGHVRSIAAKMAQAQGGAARLTVDCDEGLVVSLDAAVPIGFILHELISNALKHGLPHGASAVQVSLKRAERTLSMTVRDDGPGLPPDWERRARGTLGLNLVLALAHQLDGRFQLRNEGGAVAEVAVPLSV